MSFDLMLITLSLMLGLRQGSGAIDLRVIDAQGLPVASASVYARSQDDYKRRLGGDTDREGKFVIKDLPEGDYFVDGYKESEGYPIHFSRIFDTDTKVWQIVRVIAGKTEQVTLRLGPKCATLDLTIQDKAGRPSFAQVDFRRSDNLALGGWGDGFDISGHRKYLVPSNAPFTVSIKTESGEAWKSQPLVLKPEEVLVMKAKLTKPILVHVGNARIEPAGSPKRR